MSITGLVHGAYPDGGGGGPASVQSPIDALAANPDLIPLYLLIASPYDPGAAGTTDIYYATGAFTSDASDDPSSQVFTQDKIAGPLDLQNKLALNAGTLIAEGSSAGDIEFSTMNPAARIDELAGYLWDARDVQVLIGFPGYTLAQCAPVFTGTSEGVRWGEHSIFARLRSPRFRLERNIQTTLYAGEVTVTGTDLAFTSSTSITSTDTDLSVFGAGDVVQVVGSASNDGFRTVTASTATSLTVASGIVTEAAGASVTIRTSLEGGDELKGRPKPLVYGQVRQFSPVLVNGTKLTWQIHDGSLESIGAVKDRGVALTFDADFASSALLLAATIAGGEYGTCLAEGYIRLGSTPSGVVTVDVQGDNAGTLGASGYTSTAADIIRKIVTTKSDFTDPDEIETGSFADLNTATSAVVGIATRVDPVPAAAVLDRVAGSVGAFIDFTRNGRLRVARLVDPSTATSSDTITSIERDFSAASADVPAHTIKLGYKRYWETLTGEEVATSVDDDIRFDYGEPHRFVVDDSASAAVLVLHPSAATYEVETLLDVSADATTEATRLLSLYSPSRHVYEVVAHSKLFAYELGDVVTLQVPRYDLTSGKKFVVIGIREAPWQSGDHENKVALTLWGREN